MGVRGVANKTQGGRATGTRRPPGWWSLPRESKESLIEYANQDSERRLRLLLLLLLLRGGDAYYSLVTLSPGHHSLGGSLNLLAEKPAVALGTGTTVLVSTDLLNILYLLYAS